MAEALGIELHPDVLPFSNMPAYLPPFLLGPDRAMTVARLARRRRGRTIGRPMDTRSTYRWTRASIALVTALAAGFWVWFQLTKQPAVAAVDPFAEDPWDLVGSLSVQGAAALSLLSWARVVRLGDADLRPGRVTGSGSRGAAASSRSAPSG